MTKRKFVNRYYRKVEILKYLVEGNDVQDLAELYYATLTERQKQLLWNAYDKAQRELEATGNN